MTSDSSEESLRKKLPGVAHPRGDEFAIVAVGIFLVIIVWAVFGQTIHHRVG